MTPMTSVPLLSAIGSTPFTVRGIGCFNDAHIVAVHPALAGIVDLDLSNWDCSVHEAFDSWPPEFQVLAMARGIGESFTASDGTVGTPYILARGERLVTLGLSLTPASATNPVGTTHTVAATLTGISGSSVSGALIGFDVLSGPNAGTTGVCDPADCRTNALGGVTWTYTGSGGPGSDAIRAFADQNESGGPDIGEPQTTAEKTWETSSTTTSVDTTSTTTTMTTTSTTVPTTTTTIATTTTTTLPCGGPPVPTYESIDCRLDALIEELRAGSPLAGLQPRLLREARKARDRKLRSESANGAGNARRAKAQLRNAIRRMIGFNYALASLTGSGALPVETNDRLADQDAFVGLEFDLKRHDVLLGDSP